ncbi:FtsX-like permease family protein [Lactiplantibacillus pentosus]|uniref:FtsX-like permease family protein n=1 Tax=Lactiplantibacillus pentosus TaxID=1589 RepID=UPI0021A7BD9B|nr:FtsX-like permease family protein [Lactiplantibacillus pentosus]MCT3064294.1 hypothetical protein [Lactiplantibacillus pentosus]
MLLLSAHQFQYSWKSWMTGSFIFIIAGWLIGFCLTGIDTLKHVTFASHIDPLPLFAMPLVFGGMTLLFVLSEVIRLVMRELADEYQLWVILGANRNQLALLIAIQMGLTAFLSSWAGYGLSILSINPLYELLQFYIDHRWFPSVAFEISVKIGLVTCLIVTGIAVLSGLINTKRLLWRRHRRIVNLLAFVISLVGLGIANYQVMVTSTQENNGGVFLVLLFWLILVQIQIGKQLLRYISKKIMKLIPTGLFKVASCQAIKGANISVPILALQSLIYGLIVLLYGFGGTGGQDLKNVIVSFIVYVGAPGLLVIANVISVAMLSGRQQTKNIQKLKQLGFSFRMLLQERSWECCFQTIPFLIVALVTNTTLYRVLLLLAWRTHVTVQMGFMVAIWLPVGVSMLTWLLLTMIAWKEVFTRYEMSR